MTTEKKPCNCGASRVATLTAWNALAPEQQAAESAFKFLILRGWRPLGNSMWSANGSTLTAEDAITLTLDTLAQEAPEDDS